MQIDFFLEMMFTVRIKKIDYNNPYPDFEHLQ